MLNAFNAGGAQLAGTRGSNTVSITDDLDIATGRHAIRTGAAARRRPLSHRASCATRPARSPSPASTPTPPAQPTTFTRNAGNPDVDDRAGAARALRAGRHPRAQGPDDQRRPAAGVPVAHRRPQPGAARRRRVVAVQERQDDDSRRRRHLLRLVRRAGLRAGRAARRHASADRNDHAAGLSEPGARRAARCALPAGRVQFAPNLAAAAARRGDRGGRADAAGRRARATRCTSGGAARTCCAASTSTRRSPTACGPIPASGAITEIQSVGAHAVRRDQRQPELRSGCRSGSSSPRTTPIGRSIDETDSPFGLPADSYNLRGRARAGARLRAPPLHEPGQPAADEAASASARRCACSRHCRTTSRPAATTTATRSATIGRPASRATRALGRAQIDLGLRLSWGLAFGGAAPPPAGPQVRVVRGDSADPLGGMGGGDSGGKRYAIELYAQAYNAAEPRQRAELQRRRRLAVLRPADVRGPPRRVELGARLSF